MYHYDGLLEELPSGAGATAWSGAAKFAGASGGLTPAAISRLAASSRLAGAGSIGNPAAVFALAASSRLAGIGAANAPGTSINVAAQASLGGSGAFTVAASRQNLLFGDYTIDNGLTVLDTLASAVYVCSQLPVDYTTATSTYALGNASPGAGNVFGSPAAATPNGRQVTSNTIAGGSVTGNGSVSAWAAIDGPNSRFLVSGNLFGGQAVTSGQSFSLASFTIHLPNLNTITVFEKTMGVDYTLDPAGFASMVAAAKAAINGTTNIWTTILPPQTIDLSAATGNAITLTGMAPANGGLFTMVGDPVNTILIFPDQQNGIYGVACSNILLTGFQTRKATLQTTMCGTVQGVGTGYIDVNMFPGFISPLTAFNNTDTGGRYFIKYVQTTDGEPDGQIEIFDYTGVAPGGWQYGWGYPGSIYTLPTLNGDGSWRFMLDITSLVAAFSPGDLVGIKSKWVIGDQVRFITGSNITTSNLTHYGSVREYYSQVTNLTITNLTQGYLPQIGGQYPVLNSNEGGPQIVSCANFVINGYYSRRLGDDPIACFDTLGTGCTGAIYNAHIFDSLAHGIALYAVSGGVTVDSSCVLTRAQVYVT